MDAFKLNGQKALVRDISSTNIDIHSNYKKENSSSDLIVNRENSTMALRNVIKLNKTETPTLQRAQKMLNDDIFSPIATGRLC